MSVRVNVIIIGINFCLSYMRWDDDSDFKYFLNLD